MSDSFMTNKQYDRLKLFVHVILPGLGVAYAILSGLFNLRFPVGMLAVILGFIFIFGSLLYMFAATYRKKGVNYDGNLDVLESDTSKICQFEIKTPPEQLQDKDQVVFKVRKIPSPNS